MSWMQLTLEEIILEYRDGAEPVRPPPGVVSGAAAGMRQRPVSTGLGAGCGFRNRQDARQ